MPVPNEGGITLPQDSIGNYFLGIWDPTANGGAGGFWAIKGDAFGNLFANLRDSLGDEVGTDSNPLSIRYVNSITDLPVLPTGQARAGAFTTTTPLAGSATFTSPVIDGINFRRVTGRIFASHAGTYFLDHSDDNVTWDTEGGSGGTVYTANSVVLLDTVLYLRYWRIRFTNGATGQTTFRLSAYLAGGN